MFIAFYLQNLRFAISIFAAMVMSWCFFLYIDVWLARKNFRGMLMWLGFFLLTLSFLVQALGVETSVFVNPIINAGLYQKLLLGTRMSGYLFLASGIFIEPILSNPNKKSTEAAAILGNNLEPYGFFSLPILSGAVGLLFLYKASIGLEFHLRNAAYAFFGFAVFELLSLRELFTESSNVALFKLVAPFSWVWFLQYALLLISSLILGRWVFSYLLKRVATQLYIFFSLSVLLIFIISTVSFTRLLLGNIQTEALNQLGSNVGILKLSLDSKKESLISDTNLFAKDPALVDALENDQKNQAAKLASEFLLSKKLSSLVVVNDKGQIIARGEEPERIGDSLSENSLIKRALNAKNVSSVSTRDGVLSPDVMIIALAPIKGKEGVIGAVMSQVVVDNTFVDTIKSATGLNSSVYGGDKISATTFLAEDGETKRLGLAESNKDITSLVLGKGENYLGSTNFANTPYFSAYLPLKDIDDAPVGMLFVGKPQVTVLATAGRSIQSSFIVAGILWLFSIFPSYLIAAYISRQVK